MIKIFLPLILIFCSSFSYDSSKKSSDFSPINGCFKPNLPPMNGSDSNMTAFIDGKLVFNQQETDYEKIKQVLNLYNRPFTVLEIGSSEEYFSFKIAYEYDSCAILILNDEIVKEKSIAKIDSNNLTILCKALTPEDLETLANCEHFDVVLVRSFSQTEKDWIKTYNAILGLGDHIIIEIPCKKKLFNDQMNELLEQEQYISLGNLRSTNQNGLKRFVWIIKQKKDLKYKSYLSSEKIPSHHTYEIESDFDHKTLKKFKNQKLIMENNWIPGINLITFKCLNGIYPTKERLIDGIKDIISVPSTDWLPHNVIIKGTQLHLIDTNDPIYANGSEWSYTPELHRLIIKYIMAESKEDIIRLYKEYFNVDL